MTNAWWPLPVPDALGELLGADDVRDGVKSTIDLWAPYYIAALSQRLSAAGRIGGKAGGVVQPSNPLPQFGKWVNEDAFRSLGSGQMASYEVRVLATTGAPDTQGSGQTRATFRAQVTVQVFGTDWQQAADLTSWYEKVVRWCVLQHKSLGGLATATRWMGSQFDGKVHTSSRTQGQAVLGFDVALPCVIDVTRGPATVPDIAPPPQDETATEIELTIGITPVDEPLES